MNISRPSRISFRVRLAAGGLILAVTGVAGASAAPAATALPVAHASSASAARPGQLTSPAPPAGQVSWSVTPAGATAVDGRTLYNYKNIEPGSAITDHVAVFNLSTQSVAFGIYVTDATGTTPGGALTLLPANARPTDIGSWATFPGHVNQLSVIIPGRKGIIEPFTVAVPAHATPGDHTGAMIASVGVQRKNAAGQVVTLYQRIAVPMELRVTGTLDASLRVQSVSVGLSNPANPFGGGAAHVTYTIANTGNVRLAGSQVVTVTGLFGAKSAFRTPALPDVLPGDSIQYTVTAGSFYPAGSVTAQVTETPGWPKNAAPLALPLTRSSGTASVFAVPWALLVLIVLLVAGGYGGWRTWRWRRRAHYADLAAVAEQVRLETERRLLGSQGQPTAGTE
jgi:hypothetical protein